METLRGSFRSTRNPPKCPGKLPKSTGKHRICPRNHGYSTRKLPVYAESPEVSGKNAQVYGQTQDMSAQSRILSAEASGLHGIPRSVREKCPSLRANTGCVRAITNTLRGSFRSTRNPPKCPGKLPKSTGKHRMCPRNHGYSTRKLPGLRGIPRSVREKCPSLRANTGCVRAITDTLRGSFRSTRNPPKCPGKMPKSTGKHRICPRNHGNSTRKLPVYAESPEVSG
ncbi:hypothetical protein HMPREF9372_1146 [Sporosarcina newyorkensis 2681]|uniref:Uncharacterized protein n=1 Tax=Sporosarcina newyorkensis 2681 TaxID=1027292 RepID=F9DQR6_9BACL|nr:hypothetical protein HMPREF9372_1146 [Sporosarcina newyorkensis 2681]